MTRRPSVHVAAAFALVAAAVGVGIFAFISRSTQRPAGATSGEPDRESSLAKSDVDPIVQPLVDNDYAGALVIGVVDARGPRVFGYGSLSPDHPVPPDGRTVFPIGGLTEAFTGSLLADAAHRGDVKLDEPVTACLPAGVVLPPIAQEKMTWARIAAHTSRLPESDDLEPDGGYAAVRRYTVPQMFAALPGWGFPLPGPGAMEYKVSSFGTALLGQLLVRATGEADYEQLLLKRICRPLALNDTRITPSEDMTKRLASPHDFDGLPTSPLPPSQSYAAYDGLYSTADDLLRFVGANLGVGAPAGAPGEALQQNVARRAVANGGEMNTAYGWRLQLSENVESFHQGGVNAGYFAMIVMQPDRHLGLVLLADRQIDDTVTSEVFKGLLARMAGRPASPPTLFKPQTGPIPSPDDYVGTYDLPIGRTLTVARDGDHLTIEGTQGMLKQRLTPAADGGSFVRISRLKISFPRDDQGKVTGIQMPGPAGPMTGPKRTP